MKKKHQIDVSHGKLGMDASPNANGGTNGQKYLKKEMLTSGKSCAKNYQLRPMEMGQN